MKMKIKIMEIYRLFLLVLMPYRTVTLRNEEIEEQNRKSFYIMKVIYNTIIYRVLVHCVRNVQQSLYMGKCKYILKILKNGDKK